MMKKLCATILATLLGVSVALAQSINLPVYVPNPANTGFPPALVMGSMAISGCTGLGTGSCALAGTDNGATGVLTLSPTGSPAGTGALVLTWTPPASNPNFAPPTGILCDFTPLNGTGSWNALMGLVLTASTQLSNTLTWTNGTTPTALTAGSTYKFAYQCGSY